MKMIADMMWISASAMWVIAIGMNVFRPDKLTAIYMCCLAIGLMLISDKTRQMSEEDD